MTKVKLLIADKSEIFREGLVKLLEKYPTNKELLASLRPQTESP